jgi:hypothetical protein
MTGELILTDKTGDTRIMWNSDNPEEVKSAQKRFDELKSKGYLSYTVNKTGKQGEVLHKFDPNAERIIFTPASVGG